MRCFIKKIYKPKKVVITEDDIEISEREFSRIHQANEVLRNARFLEEIYEILIIAYKEFETKIFEISFDNMIYLSSGYEPLSKAFIAINAKLLNLLSSVTMYKDQSVHYVKQILQLENTTSLKPEFSKEYDSNIEYQFMDALRNYIQHRGLPIHYIKYPSKWTSLDGDGLLEYSLEFSSIKDRLIEDEKIKKIVLKKLGDEIDLKMAARSYVESISNIHDSFRQMIRDSVNESRKIIEDTHDTYNGHIQGSISTYQAIKIDGQKLLESEPLLLDWDDVRKKLEEKNRKLTNLKKCYVTNAIRPNS